MLLRASLVIFFSRIALTQGFSTFGSGRITSFSSKAYEVEKSHVAALKMSEDVTEAEVTVDEKLSDSVLESSTESETESQEESPAVESKGDDYSQTVYVVNLSYGM